MPVKIRPRAEPLSQKARPREPGLQVILAPSRAASLLLNELKRYANGEVKGRSFLVTGHRGAGKTTMVEQQIRQVANDQPSMRPFAVYLNGPALVDRDGEGRPDAGAAGGAAAPGAAAAAAAAPVAAAPAPAPAPAVAIAVAAPAPAPPPAPATAGRSTDEPLLNRVLQAVVLSLYQAVTREFVACARRRAGALPVEPQFWARQRTTRDNAALAARLELDLAESPSPARLQMFWEQLGALEGGLLFERGDLRVADPQQGLREIVALHSLAEAYLRISGKITQQDDLKENRKRSDEVSAGADFKGSELIKPLAALSTGALVAGGSAVSTAGFSALAWGLLAAVGASLFLKFTTVRTRNTESSRSRTFMPDLSVRTLDRVIPVLIDRLKDAGLAPVFVVDELDKVENLWETLLPLVRNLKKLFAESSFTCLLVDRSYYERLLIAEHHGQRGIHFSYFSHRVVVSYEPQDLRQYLDELLDVTP